MKKKKIRKRRRHYRRIIRNWPRGGPRPVFPKDTDEKAAVVSSQSSTPPPPAQPVFRSVRSSFFVEGGLTLNTLAIEGGYSREITNGFSLGGGLGVTTDGLFFDLVRAVFDQKNSFFLGAGLNLAKPGLGLEVFGGKKFGRFYGKIGFSTVLSLRASAGLDF